MTPQDILSHPPLRLSKHQREHYFDNGYLLFPALIDSSTLKTLSDVMAEAIDLSRPIASSNHQFDLEAGHCSESPRLRRVAYVDDLNEACWRFCKDSVVTDIACDLLGPNIRFRDVFINFKWAEGGAGVKWHQDFAFYPHTNTSTCQFLLALEDVGKEQGPLKIVPNSHTGPIYPHYDESGVWTGAISSTDLAQAGIDNAIELSGPAGSLSVHHSCAIHGSAPNQSPKSRPMLVITYSAADALPYTAAPYPSSHYGELVRGRPPRYAHHEELMTPLPPDWSGGYTSIFTHQSDT